MGSVRVRPETGALFLDFKFQGRRLREQTALPDTPANRKRLQKVLERIETEVALGSFDYQETFGRALPKEATELPESSGQQAAGSRQSSGFKDFAETWYTESEVQWRRSYRITQRGALDKYLIPHFGDKALAEIAKADVLAFRAGLA